MPASLFLYNENHSLSEWFSLYKNPAIAMDCGILWWTIQDSNL